MHGLIAANITSFLLVGAGALVGMACPVSASAQARATAQAVAPARVAPLRSIAIPTDEGAITSIDVAPGGKLILFDLLGQLFTLAIGCPREAVEGCGPRRQLTQGPAYYAQPDGGAYAYARRPHFSDDGRFVVFRSDARGGRWWRAPVVCARSRRARCPAEPVPAGEPTTKDSADARWTLREVRAVGAPGGGAKRCWMIGAYHITDRATGIESQVASSWHSCAAELAALPAITPDGQSLIATAGGKLHRIAIASGKTTPIPFRAEIRLRIRPLERFPHRVPEDSLVRARRIEHPRLSPDGSRLTFSALNRVWIMPFPDGGPERLTAFEQQGEFQPVWSPDGRHVAFIAWTDEDGGTGDVYRVRVDGPCAVAGASRGAGPCAPERLTREAAHYSDVVYAPNGAKLVLVMRPLRWPRRQATKTDSWSMGDAELAWIPADGGIPVHIAMLPSDDYQCINSRGTGLASPHFLSEAPDSVLLFQTDPDSARRALLRTIPIADLNPNLLRRDTTLVLRTERPAYARRCADVLLSPDGSHALVWVNQRELLLIDPAAPLPDVTTPTLDALATFARRVPTAYGDGAEFPAWAADGQSFTYSLGRYFYRYDLRVADSLVQDSIARAGTSQPVRGRAYVPAGVPVTVTAPRDLPQGTIAFRHARLITMRGDEVIEHGDLVVRDRRIVALGPSGRVTIPRDAHVVDATGQTIMPGLVDLHNHVTALETIHRTRVWQHEANLAYGVLTSRDPQTVLTDFLTYEDLRTTGELLGPRFMNTGRGIGSISFDTLASLAEARAVVARYAEVYGVRYLKEYALDGREARQWLGRAAAERGLNVVSHGENRSRLVQAALDGYGGYDHIFSPHLPFYDDVVQLLARTGITLAHGIFSPNAIFQSNFSPLRQLADAGKVARWYPPAYRERYAAGWMLDSTRDARSAFARASDIAAALRRVIASGGRVAIGGHGDPPGLATHFQIWAYVEAGGIPPLEALRSATLRGAEALGLERDLGSLEVGKLGDLLVLERNPLESIRATAALRYVLFNGRLYDATTLDEVWPRQVTRSPLWWWQEPVASSRRSTER